MQLENKKIVLVVDDSASIRREIKVILEHDNYIVRDVGNEIGMQNRIVEYGKMADLILMDLSLSKANGFELIEKLRLNEDYKNIPVIIVTEHANKENVLLAKRAKVQDYLVKPIRADLLKEKVREVLATPPLTEEKMKMSN